MTQVVKIIKKDAVDLMGLYQSVQYEVNAERNWSVVACRAAEAAFSKKVEELQLDKLTAIYIAWEMVTKWAEFMKTAEDQEIQITIQ